MCTARPLLIYVCLCTVLPLAGSCVPVHSTALAGLCVPMHSNALWWFMCPCAQHCPLLVYLSVCTATPCDGLCVRVHSNTLWLFMCPCAEHCPCWLMVCVQSTALASSWSMCTALSLPLAAFALYWSHQNLWVFNFSCFHCLTYVLKIVTLCFLLYAHYQPHSWSPVNISIVSLELAEWFMY